MFIYFYISNSVINIITNKIISQINNFLFKKLITLFSK
jgi:hypothetical protein